VYAFYGDFLKFTSGVRAAVTFFPVEYDERYMSMDNLEVTSNACYARLSISHDFGDTEAKVVWESFYPGPLPGFTNDVLQNNNIVLLWQEKCSGCSFIQI